MNEPTTKRTYRQLVPSEKERLEEHRRQIARELPDLQARDQMHQDARDEATLSGELRRAVHASALSLEEIAGRAGVTPVVLDDFLTGKPRSVPTCSIGWRASWAMNSTAFPDCLVSGKRGKSAGAAECRRAH